MINQRSEKALWTCSDALCCIAYISAALSNAIVKCSLWSHDSKCQQGVVCPGRKQDLVSTSKLLVPTELVVRNWLGLLTSFNSDLPLGKQWLAALVALAQAVPLCLCAVTAYLTVNTCCDELATRSCALAAGQKVPAMLLTHHLCSHLHSSPGYVTALLHVHSSEAGAAVCTAATCALLSIRMLQSRAAQLVHCLPVKCCATVACMSATSKPPSATLAYQQLYVSTQL